MAMNKDEIVVGRHYRQSTNPYDASRKVIAIENGKVCYVEPTSMKSKETSLVRFAAWAGSQLQPAEAARRYAMLATVRDQAVWFVYKYRFPMEFWYSLDGQAIYAEVPFMSDGDLAHQFDVRDLPEQYFDGLHISFTDPEILPPENCEISLLERSRRQRACHLIAIGRALADGHDIRAGQAAADQHRAKAEEAIRLEREKTFQTLDRCWEPHEELPF